MPTHDRIVDDLVLVTSLDEQKRIVDRLLSAGFPHADLVVEESLGVQAYLLPVGGGGFLEVAALRPPKGDLSAPPAIMDPALQIPKTARATGIKYTTMDVAADLALWRKLGLKDAAAACGNWKREDGTTGFWMGAAPTKFSLKPSFLLQERRVFPLPYLELAAVAPPVTKIIVSGMEADLWHKRNVEWFGLPEKNGSVYAGDTEITFIPASNPGFEFTFCLRVSRNKGTIPLADGGSIELV